MPALEPLTPGPGGLHINTDVEMSFEEANRIIKDPRTGVIGAIFVETRVDPCSAPENLIGRVEIIPTKSSECCHSGPEYYDLLEFDVVDLASSTTAALSSPRAADKWDTGNLSAAFHARCPFTKEALDTKRLPWGWMSQLTGGFGARSRDKGKL